MIWALPELDFSMFVPPVIGEDVYSAKFSLNIEVCTEWLVRSCLRRGNVHFRFRLLVRDINIFLEGSSTRHAAPRLLLMPEGK